MKGSLTFLVLALISYSLSSPIRSDKEDDNALSESLFTEDQDTGFDDDRSPKETSDLTALEEILDTEDLPRKKVEKLSKVRHQGTLKEALYKDEARDESNAMSKEEGKEDYTWEANGKPIDVLADYERRPKEDESSNVEFAGIPINNDEATHKEQGHRRQDERRTSADYEERPKEDQSSRKEFAGMRIGNDEPKRSHPKDERRKSANYEERPKEDESSNGEFAGIEIKNDEATLKEHGHRRQDERRTSAATLEKFVRDSSVSDLFEAPSGSGAETVDG